MTDTDTLDLVTIDVDIGREVFRLVDFDNHGKLVRGKKFKYFATLIDSTTIVNFVAFYLDIRFIHTPR
jgi:hypothetical protein